MQWARIIFFAVCPRFYRHLFGFETGFEQSQYVNLARRLAQSPRTGPVFQYRQSIYQIVVATPFFGLDFSIEIQHHAFSAVFFTTIQPDSHVAGILLPRPAFAPGVMNNGLGSKRARHYPAGC